MSPVRRRLDQPGRPKAPTPPSSRWMERVVLGRDVSPLELAERAVLSRRTAARWLVDVYDVSSASAGALAQAWYSIVLAPLPEGRRRELQRESERRRPRRSL